MPHREFTTASRLRSFAGLIFAVCAALLLSAEPAHAIPVFARKYQTSCTTCHAGFPKLNPVGLGFKMNGYRFSREDEEKIKQPPLQLGNETYRDMFPNSILPSTIPGTTPIAFELRQLMTTNLRNAHGVPGPGPSPDFNFPTEFNFLTAGTLTKHISFWANGGFEKGGDSIEPYVERAFLLANNLFSYDDEPDENGVHLAPRGLVLPRHLLNLKVGQFDPFVVAPYASNMRIVGITGRLTGELTSGSSHTALEGPMRGIEAYGIYRNNTSWCFGVVDGAGSSAPTDNNSHKDVYARIGRKWWGYPLDGEVVAIRRPQPISRADGDGMVTRGQSPDAGLASLEEDHNEDDPTPWMDYYRATQFETGLFGYSGKNDVNPLTNPYLFTSDTTGSVVQDNFYRIGADFQWQYRDLHILGTYLYGQDSDPGTGFTVSFNSWFLEANYYVKPWIIGYARYEEQRFQQSGTGVNDIQRAVPGVAFYPIVNLAVHGEFVIDTSGQGTTPNQFLIMLNYAF